MEPKILIPLDDSPTARKTVEAVIEQRKRFPQTLHLLYVINQEQLAYRMIPDFQLDMVRENARKAGMQLLERYEAQLGEAGYSCELILKTGDPRQTISQIANNDGYHLVVVGRHEGGGEIRNVIFGSVANHVLHNVRCPVLLF